MTPLFYLNDLIFFNFPGLARVRCVFTTRRGGCSPSEFASNNLSFAVGDQPQNVHSNRDRLQAKLLFDSWQELEQIHSTQMIFCSKAEKISRHPLKGDALATDKTKKALMIKTADCQPVLLTDSSGQYIAALHVGWRANQAGAPGLWINEFCNYFQLQARDVLAVRGPSLSPDNSEFINFKQEWGLDFLPYFNQQSMTMDLWHLTRDQLMQAGVLQKNIFALDLCTFELDQMFFSHRRQGKCGRQAALIWIE